MEVQVAEIKLRAIRRMGELSKALETAHKAGPGAEVQFPSSGKLKSEQLADAGVSTSSAGEGNVLNSLSATLLQTISEAVYYLNWQR